MAYWAAAGLIIGSQIVNVALPMFIRDQKKQKGNMSTAGNSRVTKPGKVTQFNPKDYKGFHKEETNRHHDTNVEDYMPFGDSYTNIGDMPYGKRMYKKKGGSKKRKRKGGKRKSKRSRRNKSVGTAKVRSIVRSMNKAMIATQDGRLMEGFQLVAGPNVRSTTRHTCLNLSQVNALIDETNPTIDGTSLQWQDMKLSNQKMEIVGGFDKFYIRNNYNYPAELEVFSFKQKDHSATDPEVHLNLLFDRFVVDSTQTPFLTAEDTMLYEYSDILKKSKSLKKVGHGKMIIEPGTSVIYQLDFARLKMSVQMDDMQNEGLAYIRNLTISHLFVMRGVVAHGSAGDGQSSNVGFSDAKLDVVRECRFKLKFSGKTMAEKSELITIQLDTLSNPELTTIEHEEHTNVNA